MPSPRTGNTAAAVRPASPKQALEADRARPGGMEADKQRAAGPEFSPHKPSSGPEKTWIEIVLLDKTSKPVPGEAYRVVLPGGITAAEGTLDEQGFARVEGIDPGTCKVTFPELEKKAWKPK